MHRNKQEKPRTMTSVASATTDILPSIIATAGEQAVEQYRTYFNHMIQSQSTRVAYRSMANRFLKWAMRRGLSLASISADDATDFVRVTDPKVVVPIRGLFRHFVETGVLPANPFETWQSHKMQVAARIRRLSAAAPPFVDGQGLDHKRRELLAIREIACTSLQQHRSDSHVFEFVKHLDRKLAGGTLQEQECPHSN
jgi:hypothetical protein